MKVLVGIVSFGNTQFTKLTVDSIRETSGYDLDFYIVVGKPGDSETLNWLATEPEIKFTVHTENKGFPASINDIYDYAWITNNYDYLIIAGNDIIAYEHAVDSLISLAHISDYEVISSNQVDVRSFLDRFPENKKYFEGENLVFKDFNSRCWKDFKDTSDILSINHMALLDIQNLCLYKKSVFDKIGYTDVAFYPAYYIDNDYARRIVLAGIKCCSLSNSRFFHFWSRTIKQGSGGSNHHYFENNRAYYISKWGGEFGQETKTPPLKIDMRINEAAIIEQWRNS
jgi:GT2 family glycosyltransferase